jgi:hypothetical protein
MFAASGRIPLRTQLFVRRRPTGLNCRNTSNASLKNTELFRGLALRRIEFATTFDNSERSVFVDYWFVRARPRL